MKSIFFLRTSLRRCHQAVHWAVARLGEQGEKSVLLEVFLSLGVMDFLFSYFNLITISIQLL